jgi:hypothetical protein
MHMHHADMFVQHGQRIATGEGDVAGIKQQADFRAGDAISWSMSCAVST